MTQRTLDVSQLPEHAMDSRDPVWWGNTLLIFIESTTVILLLASYFYLRRNFGEWPPPRANEIPFIGNTDPNMLLGTINLILLVASCVPMYICDMAARRHDKPAVLGWLALMLGISVAAIAIRCYEFPQLKFRWDDNAYGSLIWWLLGLHLTYLIGAALEFFIMWLYVFFKELDPAHALDVTLCGGYWYWACGTWVIIWATVYLSPRIL